MFQRRREGLVVFRDMNPMPPEILPTVWGLGSLVDRTPHSYRINSFDNMAQVLRRLRDDGVIVREIHLWSHGYWTGPFLGQTAGPRGLHPRYVATNGNLVSIREAAPDLELIWWRCCSAGSDFSWAQRITRHMEVTSVQHCVVISGKSPVWTPFGRVEIPRPLFQGAGCALRVGEEPWWDTTGKGLKGCLSTTMKVPRKFYREYHS